MNQDPKNLILAIGLSLLVIIGWQYFYAGPQLEKQRQAQSQLQQPAPKPPAGAPTATPNAAEPGPVPGAAPNDVLFYEDVLWALLNTNEFMLNH